MNAHFYAKLVASGFTLNGFMLFVESIVDKHGEEHPIKHTDEHGIASWDNCAVGLYIKTLGDIDIGSNPLNEFLDAQLGTAIAEYVSSDTIKTYVATSGIIILILEIGEANTEAP